MRPIFTLLFLTILFTSCSNYGDKVVYDGTDVYYKDGATKAEADAVGAALQDMEFTDGSTKSVMITKDSIYNFRMVTMNQYHTDESMDINFQAVGYLLSSEAFNGSNLNFQICNETFETMRTIHIEGISKGPNEVEELKDIDEIEGVEMNTNAL